MFEKQFDPKGMAQTLRAEDVCANHVSQTGPHSRTHDSGWTISGFISEDWYYWVKNFEAEHPTFGRVHGNFEDTVVAETQAAFEAFYASHPPHVWDYADI